jgi:hypothetical protein
MRKVLGWLAMALVLALWGCGGGGGGGGQLEPGSVEPSQAYLPLAIGNRWAYEYRNAQVGAAQEPIADRSTREVVATRAIGRQEWFEVQVREWLSVRGPDHPLQITTVLLRETKDGVYYYHDVTRRALMWLNKHAQVGDTWQDLAGLGLVFKLAGADETAAVPAGSFVGCVRVEEYDPHEPGQPQPHWERWFKKGVGMVLDRFWEAPDRPVDETALREYHLVR